MLLEREAELAALDKVLDAATAGAGRAAWIEGPAGIGKSALVGHVREQATRRGLRLLSATGGQLEQELPFGVVRALFGPCLAGPTRSDLLAGAAGLAVPVLDPGRADDRPGGLAERLYGLYWLTVNLAEDSPLLIVVDDAHWADEPSLRGLAYLLHRIGDLAVGMVVATRPEIVDEHPRITAGVVCEPSVTVLRPAPLGPGSSAVLVDARLGPAAEEFRAACHEASRGNPLLLRTLVDGLAADGVRPDDDGVAAVRERAPAILAAWVLPRLRLLPPPAAAVARAVAMLGPDAHLRHVAALAGADVDATASALDVLVASGVLLPGRPATFAHPLLGQVVADHTSAAELHRGHREAARRLAAEHADPQRVAAHLLLAEPLGDPEVVETLQAAAAMASDAGAPTAAITFLRRALAEPPTAAQRPATLLQLGRAEVEVVTADGLQTLQSGLAAAPDAATRARIALVASRAARSASDFHTARRVLALADERRAELDPELADEVESEIVFVGWVDPQLRPEMVRRAMALAARGPRHGVAATNVALTLAFDALHAGADSADRACELARRAAGLNEELDRPAPGVLAASMVVLLALDRTDDARALVDRAMTHARRRGSLLQFGESAVFRAVLGFRVGELGDAEADIRLAHRMVEQASIVHAGRWTTAWLLRCLVERGELAEAEALLDPSMARSGFSMLCEARGHLRMAQGRPEEALAEFRDAGRRAERQVHHPGLVEWRPHAVLALCRLGRTEEARVLVAEAHRLARLAGSARALGLALRARGVVEGSIPDLRTAVDVLASSPAALEHARALLELGAALRRAGRRGEARGHLEHAMDAAHRRGATALAARARDELAAAGARPRRAAVRGVEALTPSERRVAQLAADGLTNREIAQALFVTTKTVETHLGAAFRKLAVTRRSDVAAALAG